MILVSGQIPSAPIPRHWLLSWVPCPGFFWGLPWISLSDALILTLVHHSCRQSSPFSSYHWFILLFWITYSAAQTCLENTSILSLKTLLTLTLPATTSFLCTPYSESSSPPHCPCYAKPPLSKATPLSRPFPPHHPHGFYLVCQWPTFCH